MIEKIDTVQWIDLTLSPGGRLYLKEYSDSASENLMFVPVAEKIRVLFAKDAAHGLLHLGFLFFNETLPPGVTFWRQFSQCLLNSVCQQARVEKDRGDAWQQISPPMAELQTLLDHAPFMHGGEYLNVERLGQWWQTLLQQLVREVAEFENPTLSAYLEIHHPAWNKVGRVCFHLAENKSDPRTSVRISGNLYRAFVERSDFTALAIEPRSARICRRIAARAVAGVIIAYPESR